MNDVNDGNNANQENTNEAGTDSVTATETATEQTAPTEVPADAATETPVETTTESSGNNADAVNNITVTFTGSSEGTAIVPSGSTVAQALKAAGLAASTMTRKNNNDVLTKTTVLTENAIVTTVAAGRGG